MSDPNTPIIGYGKHIAYCDTSNGTFVPVTKTQNVALPESELGKSEVTNDDSPDFHKEYQPALYEPGLVKVTYVYTAAQFAICEAMYLLATVASTRPNATKFWKVTLPDSSLCSFKGFITKHPLPLEIEGTVVVEMEIQSTGKRTFTAATS